MDRQNVADLKERARTQVQSEKIYLFLEYAGLAESEGPDVFDPYYDDRAYAGVYDLVEQAAKRVVNSLAGS